MLGKAGFVSRVARSAALFASGSALLSAAVASVLGAVLLQESEDRRLSEAGFVLAGELETEWQGFEHGRIDPAGLEQLRALVHDEHEETKHAGMRFAVLAADGTFLAGDEHIGRPRPGRCQSGPEGQLRSCGVPGKRGLSVVAAALQLSEMGLFASAAVTAVLFSGVVTWMWSRPVARAVVSPLSRLRARVAAIDVEATVHPDLGAAEQVLEVDELRATIGQLIERIGRALEQARRFSANAAHELRTPLTTLRAELELLVEQPALTVAVQEQLGTLRTKVTELSQLVERLLILATPKRTADEPDEIVSLRDVLEDVIRSMPIEQQRQLTLVEADAFVRGDATLLSTMLSNGLNNALKFGNRARVALTTRAGESIIEIEDDGPGVGAEARERVFEAFYRDPDALRRRLPGHGLGLALVRHVAESHGGSARFVEPTSGGARLQIRLPEFPS